MSISFSSYTLSLCRTASWTLVAALIATGLLTTLHADVIFLKNGREIQGEVIQEDDARFVIQFPGGTLQVRHRDVSSIERQSRKHYLFDEADKQLRRGSYESALESYHELYRRHPDSARARSGFDEVRLKLAVARRQTGRLADAQSLLKALIRESPDNRDVQRELRRVEQTSATAQAEEHRARDAIERRDYDSAIQLLEELYDSLPDRQAALGNLLARASIGKGNVLAQARRWQAAGERYYTAISFALHVVPEVRPRLVASQLHVMQTVASDGDFDRLETISTKALEIAPSNNAVRYFQALANEGQGHTREAAEEYLSIVDIDRPTDMEKSVKHLRSLVEKKLSGGSSGGLGEAPQSESVAAKYEILNTPHFAIRHRDRQNAVELAHIAERFYKALFRQLGCTTHMRTKIRVDLFHTKWEYLAKTGLEPWSGGAHLVSRRLGVLSEHRIACFQGQPGLLGEVLPHEIAHSLFAHRLNYPQQIPLWANEGYAVLAQPQYIQNHYERVVSRAIARGKLIPFEKLLTQNDYGSDRVSRFYAQSFSLVNYLIQLGDLQTYVAFVKTLSTSTNIDAALEKFYRIQGATALQNRWLNWFQKKVN